VAKEEEKPAVNVIVEEQKDIRYVLKDAGILK